MNQRILRGAPVVRPAPPPNTARCCIGVVGKTCRIDLDLQYDRFNMEVALKLLPLIDEAG